MSVSLSRSFPRPFDGHVLNVREFFAFRCDRTEIAVGKLTDQRFGMPRNTTFLPVRKEDVR